MTAVTGPSDPQLVAGVLAGDREAFAAVYDRYGDRLYDYAHSMLRQREEAEDAVADGFVLVAERLGQLRDPERLRPWLYAIVRSECLRRLRSRRRVAFGGDERLVEMADSDRSPEEEAELTALRRLVWDAAAGLAERDQSILTLHLRHGLEGAELGEAMGVSTSQAYVLLSRLRDQVERSLGALLVARLGRDDCADLDRLLADWDGTFSPLIRKRVARHVDGCDVCGERRRIVVSPWALLAGVPLLAAPVALRDRVTETHLVASTTMTRTESGGGVTGSGALARPVTTRRALIGSGVLATLAIIAALIWSSGAEEAGDAPGTTSDSTPSASATAAPAPTTTPPPTVVVSGTLTLSTTTLDLGTSATSGRFRLTNTGGTDVTADLTASAPWVSVPGSVTVPAGSARDVTVRVDRGAVAEGISTADVTVRWAEGSGRVRVVLTQDRPPVVGAPTASPGACNVPVPVSVDVTDTDVASVRLDWQGPSGPGSATLTSAGSTWSGEMGPFPIGGTVTFRATAVDASGSTTTGPASTIDVLPCPG
ncbi:MAG: sigma-70 family RNA polymerase sigma factor [Aeromicrobium sp.]|uniref:sigma-70 family RNA polymerase sigma factor n=1 Tax=Aeromicrobium sp. TaxID=1871063 RepID=UPI00261CAB6D|nr:sigma-70 family RNA polymerase sigma factor [Aeromicrobium sp.]MDF1705781.1 sigma-70 family RNA polymerase sigma factor [Aeromicrobium sp.]